MKRNCNNSIERKDVPVNHLGSTAFTTDGSCSVSQGFVYAPFGEIVAEYQGIAATAALPKYAFNAKELDEESGMYCYLAALGFLLFAQQRQTRSSLCSLIRRFEARYYAPPTFTSRDPLFEKYFWLSPYTYCANNPMKYVNPTGRYIEVTENEDGTYSVSGGELNRDRNIYVIKDGKRTGEVIGKTLTKYSFFGDNEEVVTGAVINLKDNSGQEFIDDFMTNTPDLWTYIFNEEKGGQTGGDCDFKNKYMPDGLSKKQKDQYHYRGMAVTINGERKIASARDIGNYTAGYIAGVNGIPKLFTRLAFDLYQGGFEPQVTKTAENLGYARGKIMYDLIHPQPWK